MSVWKSVAADIQYELPRCYFIWFYVYLYVLPFGVINGWSLRRGSGWTNHGQAAGPDDVRSKSERDRLWEGRRLKLSHGLHSGRFKPQSWELRHFTGRSTPGQPANHSLVIRCKTTSHAWVYDANGSPAHTTASVVLGGTGIQERTRSTTNELEEHSQQKKDGARLGGSRGGQWCRNRGDKEVPPTNRWGRTSYVFVLPLKFFYRFFIL